MASTHLIKKIIVCLQLRASAITLQSICWLIILATLPLLVLPTIQFSILAYLFFGFTFCLFLLLYKYLWHIPRLSACVCIIRKEFAQAVFLSFLFTLLFLKANQSAQNRLAITELVKPNQLLELQIDDVIFQDRESKRVWATIIPVNRSSSKFSELFSKLPIPRNQPKISLSIDELQRAHSQENEPKALCAGQIWRVKATARPMHAMINGAGFDQPRWSIYQRKLLYAKVHSAELIDQNCNHRQKIIEQIDQSLLSQQIKHRALFHALLFGERKLIDQENRHLFIATGIAHLLAISGLHVAVAGLAFWCFIRGLQILLLWSSSFRMLNHHYIPIMMSVIGMGIYVWLAGAQPPAVRTLIGASAWLLLRLSTINIKSWQILLFCMAGIFLLDPVAVISDSFWLSCSAVAIIIFWYFLYGQLSFNLVNRYNFDKKLNNSILYKSCSYLSQFIFKMALLQIGLMLFMMPLQISLFGGTSFTSLLTNLFAVPIVTVITVPVLMLGLCLNSFRDLAVHCWWIADMSLEVVINLSRYLIFGWIELSSFVVYATVIAIIILVLWRIQLLKLIKFQLLFSVILFTCWKFVQHPNSWKLHMLDVGHGLALIIEKQGKAVLYDTGALKPYSSIAEQIIWPFLVENRLAVEQIIISHSHSDHTGGLAFMQSKFIDAAVRSSLLEPTHLPCIAGEIWSWQGLIFRALYPNQLSQYADNNASCVITVYDGKHSLLLTGDLEKEGELQLVKALGGHLKSDILQVPHHGSKTSSTAPFLRAVNPKLALNSVARFNPWNLPAQSILNRYEEYSIPVLSTHTSGRLTLEFNKLEFNNLLFNRKGKKAGWSIFEMRIGTFSPWYYNVLVRE